MKISQKKPTWLIGIDEVGRGPLAGPVTVCAVAIRIVTYKKVHWDGLTDSKKLAQTKREYWANHARMLQENGSIKYAVAAQTAIQIDAKGINPCIKHCIKKALDELNLNPAECLVLLDGGLKAPSEYTAQTTIIRGDMSEKIISLASVIAKVSRDAVMKKLHTRYPHYGWNTNKGYGTKAHTDAIKAFNITPYHRKTYLRKLLDK